MKRLCGGVLALLLCATGAIAALAPSALDAVGIDIPSDAAFPTAWTAVDLIGRRLSIGQALDGRPGFVLFVDYTCTTLCGPALVLLSTALAESGLPPESYRIIVIGLDPKDSTDDARKMLSAQVPESVRDSAILLRPDGPAISMAADAVGFHYAYDKSVDQFAHPELAFAVSADGRVRRLLSPFALTATDLKASLFAPDPPTSIYDRIRMICYRFGVLQGPYSEEVEIALKIGAALTLFAFGGAIVLMQRKTRGPS